MKNSEEPGKMLASQIISPGRIYKQLDLLWDFFCHVNQVNPFISYLYTLVHCQHPISVPIKHCALLVQHSHQEIAQCEMTNGWKRRLLWRWSCQHASSQSNIISIKSWRMRKTTVYFNVKWLNRLTLRIHISCRT